MYECRILGEVAWEYVEKVEDILRGLSPKPIRRFNTHNIVHMASRVSKDSTFQKRVNQ